MEKLKVGDKVLWRGCFGAESPKVATVQRMELCAYPRSKYGKEVNEVDWQDIFDNRVIFDLDNGCWAYSEQINPLPNSKESQNAY